MNKYQHRRNDNAIQILAQNIRKYRKIRNITIVQLSADLNVDYSQISKMERGLVNSSVSIIFDIADKLGVKPGELLEKIPPENDL